MDTFNSAFNGSDPEKYKRVKCRRIGLDLKWFSQIYQRVILHGNTTYISNKNYRSNIEFNKFKNENQYRKTISVLLINEAMIEVYSKNFENDPALFIHKNFDCSSDICAFATSFNNFKIKKNKTFYTKAQNVLLKNGDELLLVDNLTIECLCNFQN